jgi:hypothetical protein
VPEGERVLSSPETTSPGIVAEIARLRQERDAARRERDEAHYDAYRVVQQSLAAAKATGYARAVRDAVELIPKKVDMKNAPLCMGERDAEAWELGWNGCLLASHEAIIALLPAEKVPSNV